MLRLSVLLIIAGAFAAQAQDTITLATLHSFQGEEGATPEGGLIRGADGAFYGTTSAGGAASDTGGTIFRLSPEGDLTTLVDFPANQPTSTLTQGADGDFYGTTSAGGQSGYGTLFRLSANGKSLRVLASFDHDRTGATPYAGLWQGRDFAFYGVTTEGGSGGGGTIFRITSQGAMTILHSFSAARGEGTHPYGRLVQGVDGNFYGTASTDGAHGCGTIFQLSPLGGYADIYGFTGGVDGAFPRAGLLVGNDGNLYGVTNGGGAGGAGTIFRLSQGVLTTMHAFTGGADGGAPTAALVSGNNGALYGSTTAGGGTANAGTLFSVKLTGEFTALYTFSGGTDGARPAGPLAPGDDGIFYGVTSAGGQGKGLGTLFRLNLRTPPPVPGTLAFDVTNTAVGERAGNVSLVVNRTGGSSGSVSVPYTTHDGSALAGVDYLAVSGALGWIDGDSKPKTITVPVVDRGLSDQRTRTFSVALSSPTGGASLGDGSVASVGITADDPPFVPTITLGVAGDDAVVVGGKAVRIIFSRDGDVTGDLAVTYKLKGKARNGVDYQYLPGTLTIPAGSARAKLKVKARALPPGQGAATIVLVPVAPEDGSYRIEPPKVRLKIVGNR